MSIYDLRKSVKVAEQFSMVDMPDLDLDLELDTEPTEEWSPSSGSDSDGYAGNNVNDQDGVWYELETASTDSSEEDESRKDR